MDAKKLEIYVSASLLSTSAVVVEMLTAVLCCAYLPSFEVAESNVHIMASRSFRIYAS
jgi:hypothetical protein